MGNNKQDKEAEAKKGVIKKRFSGIVVSDKMNKTVTVKVSHVKIHPKYKKRYTVNKKYKVHDEKNMLKKGDEAVFVECRPLSKDKKWRVIYS